MAKPKLKLIGQDGNAFAILGKARRAAREAGWTKEQLEDFMDLAEEGDYNNLLKVVMEHFDVN